MLVSVMKFLSYSWTSYFSWSLIVLLHGKVSNCVCPSCCLRGRLCVCLLSDLVLFAHSFFSLVIMDADFWFTFQMMSSCVSRSLYVLEFVNIQYMLWTGFPEENVIAKMLLFLSPGDLIKFSFRFQTCLFFLVWEKSNCNKWDWLNYKKSMEV